MINPRNGPVCRLSTAATAQAGPHLFSSQSNVSHGPRDAAGISWQAALPLAGALHRLLQCCLQHLGSKLEIRNPCSTVWSLAQDSHAACSTCIPESRLGKVLLLKK